MAKLTFWKPSREEMDAEKVRILELNDRIERAYKKGVKLTGKIRLERAILTCLLNNIPYKKIQEGSITYLTRGNTTQRYITAKSRPDLTIMHCSKAVKNSCEKYIVENGHPPYHTKNYSNHYLGDISNFILKGGKTLSYVDIDHCFWQIAYIHGLINEKTYLRYKDNRQARLTAIGCRFRAKKIYEHASYYDSIQRQVIENPLSWVWHFVNWKSWCAMEACRKEFPIFSYHTDGCYIPDKYAEKCQKLLLDKYKLKSKIETYTILGWDAHYLVLKNTVTGKPKRTHMDITDKVKKVLKHIDAKKLIDAWNQKQATK